jgi:osmotically-inducible protein OsmY
MGVGFAKEAQFEDPRGEYVPERLAGGDWDLQARIVSVLHKSSLTNQMTDVQVQVEDGIVYLSGRVDTLDDIDVVCSVVEQVEGVVDVEEELIVTSL